MLHRQVTGASSPSLSSISLCSFRRAFKKVVYDTEGTSTYTVRGPYEDFIII